MNWRNGREADKAYGALRFPKRRKKTHCPATEGNERAKAGVDTSNCPTCKG
jgi:hypothetical protein